MREVEKNVFLEKLINCITWEGPFLSAEKRAIGTGGKKKRRSRRIMYALRKKKERSDLTTEKGGGAVNAPCARLPL